MATRGTKKPAPEAQNTAPEVDKVAPEAGDDLRPPAPRHYRCIAACYHGRRLWQVGEETITTDEMPYHFEEVKQ